MQSSPQGPGWGHLPFRAGLRAPLIPPRADALRGGHSRAIPRARLAPPPQQQKTKHQKSKKKKFSPQGPGWGHLPFRAGCARRLTLRSLRALRYAYLRAIPRARLPPPPPKIWAAFRRPNGGGGGSRTLVQETPNGGSSQACSAGVASRGKSRTTHIEDFPPDLDPAARAFRRAHSVPSSSRPKSPVGRFYEPVTRRSRGLARCLKKLSGEGQFEVIVGSFVWAD